MVTRGFGVSEARRLLPHIVRTIAEEGGRVDITVRGEPRVSIVRTADLARRGSMSSGARHGELPDALRVEFADSSARLGEVVRELRARVGSPRRPERHRGRRSRER